MAPSNSMNTMTRPLRTWPVRRAVFETGAVSVIVGMAFSLKSWLMHNSRTNGARPNRQRRELFFRDFGTARLAVAHQAVEVHADVGSFGGSIGKRDGSVERHPGLVIAAELHQKRAAHAEEMKVIRKPL